MIAEFEGATTKEVLMAALQQANSAVDRAAVDLAAADPADAHPNSLDLLCASITWHFPREWLTEEPGRIPVQWRTLTMKRTMVGLLILTAVFGCVGFRLKKDADQTVRRFVSPQLTEPVRVWRR